ncbi:MAG: hypothetical protein L3J47_00155 [Sulfurovum sp.]|nr:hypothetical protein [Sulfurovum sp.]
MVINYDKLFEDMENLLEDLPCVSLGTSLIKVDGGVKVSIQSRTRKSSYATYGIVHWEYGGYPSTKKWTNLTKDGELPQNFLERTLAILAEAKEDEKVAAEARLVAKAAAKVKNDTYKASEVFADALCNSHDYLGVEAHIRPTSSHPAMVNFSMSTDIKPETAAKLLAILQEAKIPTAKAVEKTK